MSCPVSSEPRMNLHRMAFGDMYCTPRNMYIYRGNCISCPLPAERLTTRLICVITKVPVCMLDEKSVALNLPASLFRRLPDGRGRLLDSSE